MNFNLYFLWSILIAAMVSHSHIRFRPALSWKPIRERMYDIVCVFLRIIFERNVSMYTGPIEWLICVLHIKQVGVNITLSYRFRWIENTTMIQDDDVSFTKKNLFSSLNWGEQLNNKTAGILDQDQNNSIKKNVYPRLFITFHLAHIFIRCKFVYLHLLSFS